MARLGGRNILGFLRDFASDVRAVVVDVAGRLTHPRGSAIREDILVRVLLLSLLAALGLLIRDLSRAQTPLHAGLPVLLALAFAVAGSWGWQQRRAQVIGRAHLLLGGLGGLAALTLGREWLGVDPHRAWILAGFLVYNQTGQTLATDQRSIEDAENGLGFIRVTANKGEDDEDKAGEIIKFSKAGVVLVWRWHPDDTDDPETEEDERRKIAWYIGYIGGLGAALGPTSILALYWRRTTSAGVLAGFITGAFVPVCGGNVMPGI